MLKYSLTYCVLLVFYNLHVLVVSVSPEIGATLETKILVKRNENDLQTCLDNFDIHTDKIIRTQDSRDMGAKFLKERDLSSREDCLRLCCETENCDVFVFEEKSLGSCYLFECGSPEDFKCKFTRHKNYTSAVLAVNRHLTELESQIKFTQHEHELTKLREPAQQERSQPVPAPASKTTTEPPHNKETIQLIPVENTKDVHNHKCSRYQFTCHSSGECIAIYNACDGIPQCSDGSDEAPELGCPGQTSTTSPPKLAAATPPPPVPVIKQQVMDQEAPPNAAYSSPVLQQYQQGPGIQQTHWSQQQQQYIRKHTETENIPAANSFGENPQQSLNQGMMAQSARANYGREGEGMAYQQEQGWPYQYHSNTGVSQIFTHKGNGLVQQGDRYPHPYQQADAMQGNGIQYNDRAQNEYMRYNYIENVPYRAYGQSPQMTGNWEVAHKTHETQQGNVGEDVVNNNLDRVHANGVNPQDYYYDDFYRRGQQPQMPRFPPPHQLPKMASVQNSDKIQQEVQQSPTVEKDRGQQKGVSNTVKNITTNNSETVTNPPAVVTTRAPKTGEHGHIRSSHRKMEKLTAEVTLRETTFLDSSELEGHSSSPSGAILSLTFGLCITGIMIVLVGCRMRMVHRRLRRGGKSPYAHDADFLVNGMYL